MNAQLDPIVTEFDTTESANSYDRWFHAKVNESLDDPRPSIPHDEVSGKMRALLAEKAQKEQKRPIFHVR
jgi:hypothetical protein